MRRRTLRRAAGALLPVMIGGMVTAGCGGQQDESLGEGADESSCEAGEGRLSIATGNSTGVYYVVGGGLAELINDNTEMKATAAETGASVQNIEQLVGGDYQVAFSLADAAADAVDGKGSFDDEQPIQALGRIYPNYTQVVVSKDSGIKTVADFKGKTISTGSPQSGTEAFANRMTEVAGLKKGDFKAQRLDLDQTVAGMKDGSIDGLVWSGGLPTPAMTDLFTSMGDDVRFIDITGLLPKLNEISDVYEKAVIPADTYDQGADVPTVQVPNVLLVKDDLRENVACSVTKVLYESQQELKNVHPATVDIKKSTASKTDPVPMHPGAERALEEMG